jgi:hypothetical protein
VHLLKSVRILPWDNQTSIDGEPKHIGRATRRHGAAVLAHQHECSALDNGGATA